MKKSVAIAFALASFISLVLVVISLATPVWLKKTINIPVEKTLGTRGLFEYCQYIYTQEPGCHKVPATATADFVKAFLIMAAIVLLFETIYCLLVAKEKAHCKGIPALFLVSGVFIMIAMVTFTAKRNAPTNMFCYGYSLWLGWVSMVMTVILAVVSAVMARVSDYSIFS